MIQQHFNSAVAELEAMLRSAEFLTEYPLYLLESTRVDSLAGLNRFEYRSLMGDHPLTPLQAGQSKEFTLEAGSLYLVDKTKTLHLLRPLLIRRQCPTCGSWATYYLDQFDRRAAACLLKPMEHGHDAESSILRHEDLAQAFESVGLL